MKKSNKKIAQAQTFVRKGAARPVMARAAQNLIYSRERDGSASDYAYTRIRHLILGGELAPNHRMREVELADRLGISRTPTRQALSRLELEGLLNLEPR